MIALLLLLAAAGAPQKKKAPPPPPPPTMPTTPIPGLPLAGLAQQAMPAKGCAAYLFVGQPQRTLVAMAQPTLLRVAIDGVVTDLAAAEQAGTGDYGFAAKTEYRRDTTIATLDMTIARRADLAQGAVVPEATLRIDRPGKDGVVLPVAGLIGCAA